MNRVEDDLRESKKKNPALFEASKDAILVFDDCGGILEVNRSATVLFGYSKEELLSLGPERLFFNPEERKRLWQKFYDDGFINDCEVEMKRKDGSRIIVHLSLSVIRDDRQVECRHQLEVTTAFKPVATLLLAEDEALVSLSMKKILEQAGYKVILAMDGEEALEKFREKQEEISIILSDVVMPRMSGMEFLEEVRRLKPGAKVLFISGYSANFLGEKGIFKEGLDLITKPLMKEELLRKVREVLDR